MAELRLNENEWSDIVKRYYIRGVKNRVLQELLLLRYVIFYPDNEGGLNDTLEKRCIDEKITGRVHEKVISAIRLEEIMKILNCSKVHARDMKKTLEICYAMV